jgi:hypothetical protein
MPLEEKMRRSKIVIDNSGSLEELQVKVSLTVYAATACLAFSCSCICELPWRPCISCQQMALLHAAQVQAVTNVLQQHNTFRGLLSSPLGIALALIAVVPNLRRYAVLSWHRLWQGRLNFRSIQ